VSYRLPTEAENKTIRYFRNITINVKNRMVIKYLKAKLSEESSNKCIEYMIQLRDHLNRELNQIQTKIPRKVIDVKATEIMEGDVKMVETGLDLSNMIKIVNEKTSIKQRVYKLMRKYPSSMTYGRLFSLFGIEEEEEVESRAIYLKRLFFQFIKEGE
jgi:hypothetical protein